MFDSIRNRFLLAFALAVVVAIAINLAFTSANRTAVRRGADAAAVWKARTGVDLAALPKRQPRTDSDDARALDLLLEPLELRLGGDRTERQRNYDRDVEHDRELRDFVRAAIRSGTTTAPTLPPSLAAHLDRIAATLDAAADYVIAGRDIQWREDAARNPLNVFDHVTLHRLLLARGFLALERNESATAARMLQTSQRLKGALEARQEQSSQFVAVSAERVQLALLRRGGRALGSAPKNSAPPVKERYLAAISHEAARALSNARKGRFPNDGDEELPEEVMRALASSKIESAASAAVMKSAAIVGEMRQAPDSCAELSKKRRKESTFWDELESLNAVEAWRRFAMLEIDRAITEATLTGQATSPCQSVVLTVREENGNRIIETKGLPAESEIVFAPPAVFTMPLAARSKTGDVQRPAQSAPGAPKR